MIRQKKSEVYFMFSVMLISFDDCLTGDDIFIRATWIPCYVTDLTDKGRAVFFSKPPQTDPGQQETCPPVNSEMFQIVGNQGIALRIMDCPIWHSRMMKRLLFHKRSVSSDYRISSTEQAVIKTGIAVVHIKGEKKHRPGNSDQ